MKNLERLQIAWTAVLFSSLVCHVTAQSDGPVSERHFGLSHLRNLTEVRSPRVSPNAKSIVAVLSRPDYDANLYVQQLVLVDIASGTQRVITANRPEVSRPRWSPNGTELAFLAKHRATDPPLTQVFVLPMNGGESRAVTSATYGVELFEWSADGGSIFYTAANADPVVSKDSERHNKSFEVGSHDYLTTQRPRPAHVWHIDIKGGKATRINGDDVVVQNVLLGSLTVAGDGNAVAFRSFDANRPGDQRATALSVIDLASGERRIFDNTLDHVNWGSFSPNGSRLAYSRPDNGVLGFTSHSLYVLDGNSKRGIRISEGIDRCFWGAAWMPDGQSLIAAARDEARDSLWVQSITGSSRKLDLGELNVSMGYGPADLHVSKDGGIALIASESQKPNELYWLDTIDSNPRQLTNYNARVVALELGRSREIKWEGPDGFQENGILTFPPNFDSSQRYPLVLAIHGGPMSASTLRFDVLTQLLTARGFVVFAPNYRGSDNLGSSYQSAVIHDAGEGPGKDVMAGLAAVKKLGFVDESRIAVSGWSYGGYMTTWLIGNYPEEWRVAMAGAPVTDYVDSYTLSDLNSFFLWGFDKTPWSPEGQAEWRAQSPIAYSYKITTPTLILCNTGDLRVPITESYKLYHALDERGVPVKFVAYPIPGHFPEDPVHRRDVYRRWCDWIEQRFEMPRDAPAQ